jgi:hypothetical protein
LAGRDDGDVEDEVIRFSPVVDVDVRGLVPTQSEIDRNRSLAFPLTFPVEYQKLGGNDTGQVETEKGRRQISDILNGEAVQIVLPVVLYEWSGRKYILDGHHRWSQVHALNSAGKIKAIVLTSNRPMSPLRMLAVLQLAIAAATDGVPSSSAGKKETNLLLATSNDATAAYVQANMSDAFVELYNATLGTNQTREAIGAHVMRSIAIMQLTSPVEGAVSRDLMPQTDGTSELKKDQRLWQTPLADGKINFEA